MSQTNTHSFIRPSHVREEDKVLIDKKDETMYVIWVY